MTKARSNPPLPKSRLASMTFRPEPCHYEFDASPNGEHGLLALPAVHTPAQLVGVEQALDAQGWAFVPFDVNEMWSIGAFEFRRIKRIEPDDAYYDALPVVLLDSSNRVTHQWQSSWVPVT